MPTEIPAAQHETPLRRQITSVEIGVAVDTGIEAAPLPPIEARIGFSDLFVRGDGEVAVYPVSGMAMITMAELLAIPNALQVIAAIQTLAYQKAVDQGL